MQRSGVQFDIFEFLTFALHGSEQRNHISLASEIGDSAMLSSFRDMSVTHI
jgi:hypothetical protein